MNKGKAKNKKLLTQVHGFFSFEVQNCSFQGMDLCYFNELKLVLPEIIIF